MKVALCIGHSPQDGGANCILGGQSEYEFWRQHLPTLRKELEERGHEAVIVNRSDAGGTTPSYAAMACNVTGADLAVEFHFNSSSSAYASGTESYYWHSSERGKLAAQLINDGMCMALGLPIRGIKPVSDPKDRSYNYFRMTKMPAVLVEPSFAGSNVTDCERLQTRVSHLCKCIAISINTYAQ